MCGRFTLRVNLPQILEQFEAEFEDGDAKVRPRYNISPMQEVLVVKNAMEGGRRAASFHRWGLIPFWAKDQKLAAKMINARSETIAEKPAFRKPFRKQRCLVPVDGFYEWKTEGKHKQPFYFRMKDGSLFAFAGMWDIWKSPEGKKIKSCTLITTSPNKLLAEVHDRMPVIVHPEEYKLWLDANAPVEELLTVLRPYEAGKMQSHAVSTVVNKPAVDAPECVVPLASLG